MVDEMAIGICKVGFCDRRNKANKEDNSGEQEHQHED